MMSIFLCVQEGVGFVCLCMFWEAKVLYPPPDESCDAASGCSLGHRNCVDPPGGPVEDSKEVPLPLREGQRPYNIQLKVGKTILLNFYGVTGWFDCDPLFD